MAATPFVYSVLGLVGYFSILTAPHRTFCVPDLLSALSSAFSSVDVYFREGM